MTEQFKKQMQAEARRQKRVADDQLIRGLVLSPLGTNPERDARVKAGWRSQKS